MRAPLLLLLALLALLTTFARAETPQQGTLRTSFQGFVQKVQEQVDTIQGTETFQKIREAVQNGISRSQEALAQVKIYLVKLLEMKAPST